MGKSVIAKYSLQHIHGFHWLCGKLIHPVKTTARDDCSDEQQVLRCIEHVIFFSIDCLCKAFCVFKAIWANNAVAHNLRTTQLRVVDVIPFYLKLLDFSLPNIYKV